MRGIWKKPSHTHPCLRKLPHDANYHTPQDPETSFCRLAFFPHSMPLLSHQLLVQSQIGHLHWNCHHVSRSVWDRFQFSITLTILPTCWIQLVFGCQISRFFSTLLYLYLILDRANFLLDCFPINFLSYLLCTKVLHFPSSGRFFWKKGAQIWKSTLNFAVDLLLILVLWRLIASWLIKSLLEKHRLNI